MNLQSTSVPTSAQPGGALDGLYEAVYAQAVESFAYFANHVLGFNLDASLCADVQRAVEELAPMYKTTKRTASLLRATTAWLDLRGQLHPTVELYVAHELLVWLGQTHRDNGHTKKFHVRATVDAVILTPMESGA